MDITLTRQHSGILLTTIYKDQYYKKLYIDFPWREAKKDFRKFVKAEDAKIFREKR